MNILNTRPTHQSLHLTALLENNKHVVSCLPLIDIQPTVFTPIKTNHFDHCIFLSANAVKYFFKANPSHEFKSVIAIGSATQRALMNHGISNSITPMDFSSEGVLSLSLLQKIKRQHIAIISGEDPKSLLQKTLEERGAIVHRVFCYRRVPATHDLNAIFPRLQSQKIDVIITTSSESLAALLSLFKAPSHRDWLLKKNLCVISDKMKAEAIHAGFQSIILTHNATDEAILLALQDRARRKLAK